jgi:hypothetical protein
MYPKVGLTACGLLILSGCVNISMQCPDKTSTVSYQGLSLTGNTSVSCVGSPLGGDTAVVTGMDLAALAMMVAPLVAARPLHGTPGGQNAPSNSP